ncbi:putative ATP-dependent RNA helicase DDX31 isoform X3 [Histomonas meleagridis]|uniref:putative ATP-dependent RNA helicase DDX31 isoform X3 n=1 Tax=Histomonas meleagridis TaxID=135588 RepID=UPI003559D6ED|nr:putative ATP-dependent RNA helicase DDX31 isoform X3 [Histomonas meleagridis]
MKKKDIEQPTQEIDEKLFSKITPDSLNLNPYVYDALVKAMNIQTLTKIQAESYQPIIDGRDILMRADTGSGKTLSYLIPLMQILTVRFPTEVNPIKRSMGPLAIIICPTRELCLQTYSVIHKMNSSINFIVAGILIGGEKVNTEKKRIRKGINILITTPSRFLYHLHNTQNFKSFPNLQFLVLDEADRLLDLGFFKPITEIIESLPPRQTILISATLTEDLKALTNLSLNDPITIGVHTENQKDFSIPPQLQQRYLLVDIRQRLVMLALLLRLEITNARRRHTGMKSIVFINTCDSVDFHYHFFSFFDFKTDAERGHVPRLQYNEMQKRNKQEATIIDIHSSTDNDEIGSYSPYLKCPIFRIHGNVEQIERSS